MLISWQHFCAYIVSLRLIMYPVVAEFNMKRQYTIQLHWYVYSTTRNSHNNHVVYLHIVLVVHTPVSPSQ